jgi:Carbohydrate binding domain
MKLTPLFAAWALLTMGSLSNCLADDAGAPLFPFSLPADGVTEGITDLSFLNARPANRLITVRDAHFFAGDARIRFWGVCIIGLEAFPSHEDATLLARRLANRGFNQARIHLIDGGYAPQGLFDPEHKGELRILPAQLDKLDYFIAELKNHGIYVELSVHGYHWRNVSGGAQYPVADLRGLAPFSSGIPLWDERFVAGEKQFARDFFGHVNPYTGSAYTEEPAVSTLEILNENGILCAWRGGHFKLWPLAMSADLQARWNQFLAKRYPATDQLRQAWASGEIRPDKQDMLQNGAFADGTKSWGLQRAKPSSGSMEIATPSELQGKPCVVIDSLRSPEKLAFVNLNQTGLTVEKGVRYRLSFWARSEAAGGASAKVHVTVSMNHAPWSGMGLGSTAEVGADWREAAFTFVGAADENAAKLMIEAPVGASRLSFTGFSLRRAEVVGLPANESLPAANVSMPLTPPDCLSRTGQFAQDWVDFLFDLDAHYFDAMRDFLEKDLHCRHPIKGTQVDQYSSYFSQARFDYVDSHGYWQHPSFPHKPWDREDWFIGNSPMINAGEEMAVELAERRVDGRPFNVSEYCHPAPSTYCAEQIPTIASIGAFQDWDGIIFHCWQEMTYDWSHRDSRRLPADRIDGWFNMSRHPVKLVTLPFGALAFRRGDIAPGREESSLGVTLDQEKRWAAEDLAKSWRAFDVAARRGATWRDVLTHRVGLALGSTATPPFLPLDLHRAHSDTGELDYDLADQDRGVLAVNTPRAKAVIGFGAGKTFDLGDVIIRPGSSRQNGYSVITASVVKGENFHSPGARLLVTATGYVENQGMAWNGDKTSVGNKWGEGPVMCEGIPVELTLKAEHAAAWPLDGQGHRLGPIPGETVPNGVRFIFGPTYKTLWYEIAVN